MILDGQAGDSLAAAAALIKAGELLGLPTETVYGLAADASNPMAVAKIFEAKGRPADHPLIVHVLDAGSVAHFASEVPDFAARLMAEFWPGPLTLILPRRAEVAAAAAGGQNSVGLRSPSHPVAQALLRECLVSRGATDPQVWGIAAPSANKFGRVSPTTAAHVQSEFGDALTVLDGGPCEVGIESTIIDCTRGVPVLLRPGAITAGQVQVVCGQKVLSNDEMVVRTAPAPRASGTLESHYAPNARVHLLDAQGLQSALDLMPEDSVGVQPSAPLIATYSRTVLNSLSTSVLRKRMPDDATAAAHQLFAMLREMDDHGVQMIWVETPPNTPEWDGVRDRLQRAAAG